MFSANATLTEIFTVLIFLFVLYIVLPGTAIWLVYRYWKKHKK